MEIGIGCTIGLVQVGLAWTTKNSAIFKDFCDYFKRHAWDLSNNIFTAYASIEKNDCCFSCLAAGHLSLIDCLCSLIETECHFRCSFSSLKAHCFLIFYT